MEQEKTELEKILDDAPLNNLIADSLIITHSKLQRYDNILCTVSGGSDSDIMLDLCEKYTDSNKITYAFFDTGIEFTATREHLEILKRDMGLL